MEKENIIWKDIEGYVGLYQVSSTGLVRSLLKSTRNKTGMIILSQGTDPKGYKNVVLSKNKVKKSFKVHRLIAQTFIPNPSNLTDVNHKNENPSDNRVENLEWVTHKQNMNYGSLYRKRFDTFKERGYIKQIVQMSLDGNIVKIWDSVNDAAKTLNITTGNLVNCCKGRCKTYAGYKWAYYPINDNDTIKNQTCQV